MGNRLKRVAALLNKYHLGLVVLLSLVHIGLSCIHVRESGRADRRLRVAW